MCVLLEWLLCSTCTFQGDPGKGGRIDVAQLMAELRRRDSEDSEQSDQLPTIDQPSTSGQPSTSDQLSSDDRPSTSDQPSSNDQPSTSDRPSSSVPKNTLTVPNGIPPIKESSSHTKTGAKKPPRSPSARPMPRSPNSSSKPKASPRPLAAVSKTDPRRVSDSAVKKLPTGPPKAARPGSVSSSKMQGRSSSMGPKKTSHS